MGFFSKFKNLIKKEEKEEVQLYEKGLEKTRNSVLSRVINLNKNRISDF